MTTKTIKVGYLARVEGEGSLFLKIENDQVTDVKLKIFEPPRFFEAFLRGRSHEETPDITARICGICPVAYQMSAVHALERACGVSVTQPIRELRRLLYCGEWLESHTLHIFMLHAPDFLGFPGAVEMAKKHPDIVKRGLFLKKTGNAIVTLLGGREIHPINVRLGGFYKIPPIAKFRELLPDLQKARDETLAAIEWIAKLPFPDFERDYELVALRHENEYPMNEGRIVSSKGLDVDADQFEDVMEEHHVAHTNALQATLRGRGAYLCGPLARFSLNYDLLPSICQKAAEKAGIAGGTLNPYKSIIVRAIEVLYAFDEAIRIITSMIMPPEPFVPVTARPATGRAATEAPRGLLFHRYRIDDAGRIAEARIIPPTSQNQLSIEEDLRQAVPARTGDTEDNLRAFCEQTIRNYDPCISCATHFLKIKRIPQKQWLEGELLK